MAAVHSEANKTIQKQQSIMKKQTQHDGHGLRAIYESLETTSNICKQKDAELKSQEREIERLEKSIKDLTNEIYELEMGKRDTPLKLPMLRAFKAGYLEGAEQAISWNEDKHIEVNFNEEVQCGGINVIVDIDEEVSLEGRLDMPYEHSDMKCLQ